MGVQGVEDDGLEQIIDGTFYFQVLADQVGGLGHDELFLQTDELVEGEGLVGITWERHQEDLADGLEVVLDPVLDDVIDVDDELLELV